MSGTFACFCLPARAESATGPVAVMKAAILCLYTELSLTATAWNMWGENIGTSRHQGPSRGEQRLVWGHTVRVPGR